MKHTRVVSTKCTAGFACRAFSDTTLVCFIVNEHTTKCSHYRGIHHSFKRNQNEPYWYWRQGGDWHAIVIVMHATARLRVLYICNFTHPAKIRPKSPRIVIAHYALMKEMYIHICFSIENHEVESVLVALRF